MCHALKAPFIVRICAPGEGRGYTRSETLPSSLFTSVVPAMAHDNGPLFLLGGADFL